MFHRTLLSLCFLTALLAEPLMAREFSKPQNFQGFKMGLGALRASPEVTVSLNTTGTQCAFNAQPQGFSLKGSLAYGYEVSGFFIGIEGYYQQSWSSFEGSAGLGGQTLKVDLSHKNGFGGFLLLGKNFGGVLPYLKAGYVAERMRLQASTTTGTNLSFDPLLLGAFSYGIGLDTKVAPQVILGFEIMFVGHAKEKQLSLQGQPMPLSSGSMKLANSLGTTLKIAFLL
ncbi:MAG: hypothetical protein V6Z78_00390 [Holosporaceae bacterium]